MYHEPERDDRTYWSPADEPVGGALDAEPLLPELAQPAKRRHTHPQPRGPEPSPRIGLGREEAVERVGGRHRFRPEVVLSIAGVPFVILALLKPWPNAVPARQPALIAVVTPAAAITAGPSPAENTAVQVFQLGVPNGLVQRWSAVDWSLLRATDPRAGWGVAAVFMPSVGVGPAAIEGPAGPRVISPMSHWVTADPLTSSTTVLPVVGGQNAYAIAVTWPHDLRVSAVTFQFVSGSDFEPYSPPLGFPPLRPGQPTSGQSGGLSTVRNRGEPGRDFFAANWKHGDPLWLILDPAVRSLWGGALKLDRCGGLAVAAVAVAQRNLQGDRDVSDWIDHPGPPVVAHGLRRAHADCVGPPIVVRATRR